MFPFHSQSTITAFASVDPVLMNQEIMNKKVFQLPGRVYLIFQRLYFQVMDVLIKTHPQDDHIYQFLDRGNVLKASLTMSM